MPFRLRVAMLLHVVGFVLWVGGLLGAAWLLHARNREQQPLVRAGLAAAARRQAVLPDIGATLAIAAGLDMLIETGLLSAAWMHIKLTLAAVLVGLHVAVRALGKRAATRDQGFPPALVPAIGLVAVAIIALAVLKVPVGR